MSHIVTIQARLHDFTAIDAACRRLRLAVPTRGSAKLFSGEAHGVVVRLPEWQYPIVINTDSGQVAYDNYEGHWGNQKELGLFLQAYAVEKAKLEGRKKGYQATEQQLQDGSIQIRLSQA